MDSKQYNVAVLGTESKPQTINFGTIGTHAMLGLIYQTGEMVDVAKKAMFYGKQFDRFKFAEDAHQLADLANTLRQQALDGDLINPRDIDAFTDLPENIAGLDLNDSLNKRLLHVVFGTSSESSEIANELRLAWEEKRPVDRVNMSEEIGDHLWYLAVGADELQVPLSVIFQQNITKLNDKKVGRYKQGAFSIDGAINRDLEAERANLAGSLGGPVNETRLGQRVPVVYGGAAEYRNHLVPTSNGNIFYQPETESFVVFDEAALEHSKHDSFKEAQAELTRYGNQLNGHCGTCSNEPVSLVARPGDNAGTITLEQSARIADSQPGQVTTLERCGAAAKSVAVKGLDALDSGVDKAKSYLSK